MHLLKGGLQTSDPRLDRVPQYDEASRAYPVLGGAQPPIRPWSWRLDPYFLNQHKEGRCVEFSLCNDAIARPKVVDIKLVRQILEGRLIYWPAQRDDEWEGGSYPGADPFYEGTSVLSGVKQARKLGLCTGFEWAFSEAALARGIRGRGPAILGIPWYTGMFEVDSDGFYRPTGIIEGYHAIACTALSLKRDAYFLPNTWGEDHGVTYRGGAGGWVRRGDMREKLLPKEVEGEACFLVGRQAPKQLNAA